MKNTLKTTFIQLREFDFKDDGRNGKSSIPSPNENGENLKVT